MRKTIQYIEQLKKHTKLNNYQIAKKYNINQSNFNKYANGSAQLSVNHAFLIGKILDIPPAQILIDTKIEKAKITNNDKDLEFWLSQQKSKQTTDNNKEIVISQFNSVVGDIYGNTQKIIKIIEKYNSAELIIFPELAICGYPLDDLLLHNSFITKINQALLAIIKKCVKTSIILGTPIVDKGNIYNAAIMIKQGKIYGKYYKQKLPNYGVFDEKRYFTPGTKPFIFILNNKICSILICEDAWDKNIIKQNCNLGVDTIISINSSPFCYNKYEQRIAVFKELFTNKLNLIYVNAVGGQDNLIFDGGSFILDKSGMLKNCDFFIEKTYKIAENNLVPINNINLNTLDYCYDALVFAIKEYFTKVGSFDKAIIALSGGIDSAFTLSLAVDALTKDKVMAIMMPYMYTSKQSLIDAKEQIAMLGVQHKIIDISSIVDAFCSLNIINKKVTLENIQARIRGSIIMSIANDSNALVLTTSNKSESSVGYCTLYGDMVGGFAPIKDVYKTDIYRLANHRNTKSLVIPKNVITKQPSAELAYNQFDTDSLPSYQVLDQILKLFIDESNSLAEIVSKGFNEKMVKKIIKMVVNSEYKRKQSTLGTKFTNKSFERERRYPIINKFDF